MSFSSGLFYSPHLSLGFCLNFMGVQRHGGVGRCGWSSVNTAQHLLGVILSGLQWPVGRVSEASSGALSTLLLPVWPACCPAAQVRGFPMFLQCGASLPGCPERPFHRSYATLRAGNPRCLSRCLQERTQELFCPRIPE